MINDPIVEEIRRHRQKHAEENKNDLTKSLNHFVQENLAQSVNY